MKIILETRRVH